MESMAYSEISKLLEGMAANPEALSDEQRDQLKSLRSILSKALGFSEHVAWEVRWRVV